MQVYFVGGRICPQDLFRVRLNGPHGSAVIEFPLGESIVDENCALTRAMFVSSAQVDLL